MDSEWDESQSIKKHKLRLTKFKYCMSNVSASICQPCPPPYQRCKLLEWNVQTKICNKMDTKRMSRLLSNTNRWNINDVHIFKQQQKQTKWLYIENMLRAKNSISRSRSYLVNIIQAKDVFSTYGFTTISIWEYLTNLAIKLLNFIKLTFKLFFLTKWYLSFEKCHFDTSVTFRKSK